MQTIMHLHTVIIICGLKTRVELKNRHVCVDRVINRFERGLCRSCISVTRIIHMRIYFVYDFKLEIMIFKKHYKETNEHKRVRIR